ncbi:hypothetical protein [Mesorhizobium sp.]|uniref:hypothetical protein n=1 Tax=Mesorhizobium sp. TaxID=1871066 RepID=UPI000FE632D3|nr:hypothetical protein [Mesorhizobium sp.]RWM29450.1 MAG: hypothetical protein EOR74_07155 [Mesorhizobium sp.]
MPAQPAIPTIELPREAAEAVIRKSMTGEPMSPVEWNILLHLRAENMQQQLAPPVPQTSVLMDELRHDLAKAENELACADMIDNHARRQAEMERWRRRRDDVKAQIARIEESF